MIALAAVFVVTLIVFAMLALRMQGFNRATLQLLEVQRQHHEETLRQLLRDAAEERGAILATTHAVASPVGGGDLPPSPHPLTQGEDFEVQRAREAALSIDAEMAARGIELGR